MTCEARSRIQKVDVYDKWGSGMKKKRHKRTRAQIEADAHRPGRPPKRPAEKRGRQVNVRMTPGEWKRLSAEARRLGVSMSALLMRPWRKGE